MPLYHARDLRKGRCSEPGRAYLVTTVTRDREPAFCSWQAGACVARELVRAQDQGGAESLAWVLMPDHLHWLLVLRCADLSDLVAAVKARSAREWNRQRGRQGALWQGGFHDHSLRAEEDLRRVARYVVANPLRAGLVEDLGSYPLWDAVWL